MISSLQCIYTMPDSWQDFAPQHHLLLLTFSTLPLALFQPKNFFWCVCFSFNIKTTRLFHLCIGDNSGAAQYSFQAVVANICLANTVFMKKGKRGRALYALQSPPDMNRALLKMAIWAACRKVQRWVGCAVVVRDLGTHGPLWAFVESLESSKI